MNQSDFQELKEKAKQKDITEYLSRAGIKPKNISGNSHWYVSPIRNGDSDPSFKVNTNINKWYDFGTGEKGDIVDLVQKLENKSFLEAMKSLVNSIIPEIDHSISFGGNKRDESKIILHRIKPLNNQDLINYIKSRFIRPELATKYFLEAYYFVKGQKKEKPYYSLAFKNDKGGYELRNKYYSSAVTPKYFTTIKGTGDCLNIFEGGFDFLSSLEYYQVKRPNYPTIILNSVAFVDKILPTLKKYETINSYLDNDSAGEKALEKIKEVHSRVKNWSMFIYPDHNDFNDYIMEKKRKEFV